MEGPLIFKDPTILCSNLIFAIQNHFSEFASYWLLTFRVNLYHQIFYFCTELQLNLNCCRIFKLSEMLDLLEAEQLITMDTVQQVKQFLGANQDVTPKPLSSVEKLILSQHILNICFVFRQKLLTLPVVMLLLILLPRSCFI